MNSLAIQNLSHSYFINGVEAVIFNGLTFEIRPGEITAIMGESGAGKTTFGKILGGALEVQKGSVIWPPECSEERQRLYWPQDPMNVISMHRTVYGNLEWPLKQLGISSTARRSKIESVLKAVMLEKHSSHLPKNLSGGQVSRLALAIMLITEPRAVVLDEALDGLDEATKSNIIKVLSKRASDSDLLTIFIAHNPNEVLKLADRCLILSRDDSAKIVRDVKIDLSRPRDDKSNAYHELLSEIRA